jgi:hypothetical protein
LGERNRKFILELTLYITKGTYMKDFLKRHKLLTRAIKSIVFLAILGVLGAVVLTSYISSKSTRIGTLDRNSTGGVSSSIQAGIPVFIEICRPVCAQQLPEVEAAAQELEGRVTFFQLDPESEPELMATLSEIIGQPIATYPAHIVLAKESRAVSGMKTSRQLVDFIVQAAGLQASPAAATAQPGAVSTAPAVTYTNITVANEQTFESVLAGVTTPVYIFLCEGHECEIQAEALDAVAGRYAGRIKFIQVNWYENPNVTLSLARAAQMPIAFPIHVLLSPDGAILNYAAVLLQDAQIEQFISDGLARGAAMSAGNNGANPSTPSSTRTPLPVTVTVAPVAATPAATASGAR